MSKSKNGNRKSYNEEYDADTDGQHCTKCGAMESEDNKLVKVNGQVVCESCHENDSPKRKHKDK